MLEMDRMAPSRVNTVMAKIVRRRMTRRDARWGFSGGADHFGRSEEEREEEVPLPRRGVCPGRGEGGWRVFWISFHQPIAEITPPFTEMVNAGGGGYIKPTYAMQAVQ